MSNDHHRAKPLKISLIAGETSGDMLGGQLMTALNKISNLPIEFSGIGGEKMKEQGLNSFFPISDLSIIGISEMLHEESVPPTVSIVEGVEIAKLFSTDDSSRFVNGILDSVYNDSLKGLIKFEK